MQAANSGSCKLRKQVVGISCDIKVVFRQLWPLIGSQTELLAVNIISHTMLITRLNNKYVSNENC